jgi:integrase
VIEKTLHQISDDPEFTTDEMVKLRTTSAHAFRHTFGMHAVRSMKLNSVREILGHESIDTTSIYSREEEREVSLDAHKFFAKDAAEPPC